jgi:hypothetical protein
MRIALIVTMMAAAAANAGAQTMVHEPHGPEGQKALQVLLEKTPATGVHVTVETKAVTGAPYRGEAVTEFVQTLTDGNRITRRTATRVYRDSAGRTRREFLDADGQVSGVAISDPTKGTSYMLHPASQTGHETAVATTIVSTGQRDKPDQEITTTHVVVVDDAAGKTAAEKHAHLKSAGAHAATAESKVASHNYTVQAHVTTGDAGMVSVGPMTWVTEGHAKLPPATKESLGEQTIEGVRATGTRSTMVIPAGTIGNDLPITVVSEEWFSPELQVLVMTKHSDPRMGETTYRLTGISRTEPDASLFTRPAGYTVK